MLPTQRDADPPAAADVPVLDVELVVVLAVAVAVLAGALEADEVDDAVSVTTLVDEPQPVRAAAVSTATTGSLALMPLLSR